ncbi:MAG: hypothetical protein N2110_00390 [Flavobacteriales bacterium]|nr:hypothetical protein [Flavobacteriales bacterium]
MEQAFDRNILLVYYSNAGQTRLIAESLTSHFSVRGARVYAMEVKSLPDYPFPWTRMAFFNAFPETVFEKVQQVRLQGVLPPMRPDVVILCFSPWFLHISRPFNSFLQGPEFQRLGEHIPVIAVVTCRNMWLAAVDDLKRILGKRLRGFFVLEDRHPNLVSLFTTLNWMLKGKRRLWSSFGPEAGLTYDQITDATQTVTNVVWNALLRNDWSRVQEEFIRAGTAPIRPGLLLMERKGRKSFLCFARFILKSPSEKQRLRRVRILSLMLPIAVIILSPLTAIQKKVILALNKKKFKELCRKAASLDPLPDGFFARRTAL